MKKGDYGFYGKGIDGYVHYMQAFNETQKGHSNSRPRSQQTQRTSFDKESDSEKSYVADHVLTVIGVITLIWIIASVASYMP